MHEPWYEHDACGVGFIADLNNNKTHTVVKQGIEILENLEHRGAVGAEPNSGDGAGLLIQMPDAFLRKECEILGIKLPPFGDYGSGIIFFPSDNDEREAAKQTFEDCVSDLGQKVIGWRDVPTNNSSLGSMVKSVEPKMMQVFIERGDNAPSPASFERKLYVIRKWAAKQMMAKHQLGINNKYYVSSLSYKTMTYKGMLMSLQVAKYFPDLSDPSLKSALALVHSRFSTNTMPSWPLAQPFRYLAHNGEINTLRGNVNWMKARESLFQSDLYTPEEIKMMVPVINDTQSDSAIIDNAVELLVLSGRSIPHVMSMLIPEEWQKNKEMTKSKRSFYEFHATLMEPWDGPASIAFTDGEVIGATLDRNGLRPSRYMLTDDNILIMASETGVLDVPPEKVVLKGRLQPGRMFVASLEEHRIIPDGELKERLASERPYARWLAEGKLVLEELGSVKSPHQPDHNTLTQRQAVFGYTREDLAIIMQPMVNDGKEPIGSMGNDVPVAVLSDQPQTLFNYFYQLFAQVTNPPIDPIREESVMSLTAFIGSQGHLLTEGKDHCRVIEIPQPVITNDELEKLRKINLAHWRAITIDAVFEATKAEGSLQAALDTICDCSTQAISEGYNVIILSDRKVDNINVPIPSLLATAAVHHHLIREGTRARCGLVVETGEANAVHHFACLLGYGASAVNPYLAFETVEDMRLRNELNSTITKDKATYNYINAVGKGLLKIMSKMGISTVQSYIGAQIFEAVGLSDELIEKYFVGTASRLGGIGINVVEKECLIRHKYAYHEVERYFKATNLEPGGSHHWRARGERHTHNPDSIQLLQRSTRHNDYQTFKQYSELIDDQANELYTIRGLLDLKDSVPVSMDEVEPIENIVRRFFTGAMSFGSISKEAHENIAIAMNRLHGRSNTGEGGEDPERFKVTSNGDSKRSAIKQVASGRFGVTSNYLVNADELQIKMAQGAKPGEGGQLPGPKVDKVIARIRHSTPGVGLISPPPHHDIYSIEDLAQLIFDLKNSNDKARINVKLVSEVGVGTIAAGVCKGHSEAVLISGHDGGTGASPRSSIKHAGLPWELGLAETHQVLMENNLRSRIVVQTDGRILTGLDCVIATLLGAEEWGVATGVLIVSGCVMMRKCHLNLCPVGVATQNAELRKNFPGNPEHIVNYFTFLAREIRELMARIGIRTINEMVGRSDLLKMRGDIDHWKARHLNLDRLLYRVDSPLGCASYQQDCQSFDLDVALDKDLIKLAKPAIENGNKIFIEKAIRNTNRTTGTLLSAEISRKYGEAALPEDSIAIKLHGSAGQSFCAFGAGGITMELEGDANDYFCKGLSGAKVIIYPPKKAKYIAEENVIVGNVAFYGATKGKSYVRGVGGERFCVRNSGARVVVEAVGDHGCEYMTGGRVIILGSVGLNFAAGMSGGIAYILDKDGKSRPRINIEMVELEELVDFDEILEVKGMIKDHFIYTKSKTAAEVLENWEKYCPMFIKVMPKDYKRAIAIMAAEKAETKNEVVTM
tara:strand:- start:88263 stop:92786 length:4524 start_codon:yes stop_codon:yes gene_type:complete